MTTQQPLEKPADWPGSLPEYLVHEALIKLGKEPDVDFFYQSPFAGGRMQRGGLVLDFIFVNPPDLVINVQGEYYHYEMGADIRARDLIARSMLAGDGITLIFIDESDVHKDAIGYTRDALRYRDRSRLGGGV